jgi:translation initiation factor IF-2
MNGSGEFMKPKAHVQADSKNPKLEIILKCDSIGSVEAVTAALSRIAPAGTDIKIISSGVGAVTRTDILLAETSSRLVIGFQIGVIPGLEKIIRERRVEVRLYDLIYRLSDDMASLADKTAPRQTEEEIVGSATIVALFKSVRKGVIIGCEVRGGQLAVGQHFRIISAMGPVYKGIIESLHIGEKPVDKAVPGQQVGIKIRNFKQAKTGDFVESYRLAASRNSAAWEPKGDIIRL